MRIDGRLDLPFFIFIADHVFTVGLPDGASVTLALREQTPNPPDGRYQWLVQPGVRLLRDRYGRVRFTQVGFQFEVDPTKYPSNEQGRFDALNAFVLPALNRLLAILRTAGDLNYLPRVAYSDLIQASFDAHFPSFLITSGGLQVTGPATLSDGKFTAPNRGPLPSEKISLVEGMLSKQTQVSEYELFRALARDTISLEDYWLGAVYLGMALEAEIDALLNRGCSSLSKAEYTEALEMTIGKKGNSAAILKLTGGELKNSRVGMEFKRLLSLRNSAVHKRSTSYVLDGVTYSLSDQAAGTEHVSLLGVVVTFLRGF